MADDAIVDGAVDTGSTTNDGAKPDSNGQQNNQQQAPNPGSAPDTKAADARYNGILADLQKERKARQQFEQQSRDLQTRYEQENRRVQALAGLSPKSAEEAEAEQIRSQFAKMFPDLAGITAADLKALREMQNHTASFQEEVSQRWSRHGEQMLSNAVEAVAKELGGTLTDRQASRIKQAYVAAAEADPQFLARHEKGDPKLIAEFVKEFAEDFFAPAKRNAIASESARMRGVPSGRDRSVAATGGKKINYNDPKATEDAMWESFTKHGGGFGQD